MSYIFLFPFLPLWWLQKLIPRSNKIWIFGAWHGHSYSDNSKSLFEYVNKNHTDIKCIWLTRNKDVLLYLKGEGHKCYKIFSIRGALYSLIAGKIIICCSKSDVNRFFLNGGKFFHLWHGAPMKKIGLDEKIKSQKRKENNRELDNYFFWRLLPKYIYTFFDEYKIDYLLSTSSTFNRFLQSAFDIAEENILTAGYPRNDILFNKNLKKSHYKKDYDFLILYLPTFRSGGKIDTLLDNYNFSYERMTKILKKINGRLLFKEHFAAENHLNKTDGNIINLKDNPLIDINHILKDADILITDYSGCYFDYLLLNKPIIFAPFDYSEYINNDRELYFQYNDIISGPIANNWIDVEENILKIYSGKDSFEDTRIRMMKFFNKYNDAFSSKRVFTNIYNI